MSKWNACRTQINSVKNGFMSNLCGEGGYWVGVCHHVAVLLIHTSEFKLQTSIFVDTLRAKYLILGLNWFLCMKTIKKSKIESN